MKPRTLVLTWLVNKKYAFIYTVQKLQLHEFCESTKFMCYYHLSSVQVLVAGQCVCEIVLVPCASVQLL